MGGVGMAQTVNREMFVDATVFPCRLDRGLHTSSIHRAAGQG